MRSQRYQAKWKEYMRRIHEISCSNAPHMRFTVVRSSRDESMKHAENVTDERRHETLIYRGRCIRLERVIGSQFKLRRAITG